MKSLLALIATASSLQAATIHVPRDHARVPTAIQHPRLKRHYSLTGNPGACGFWRDRVVIPAGYQGLLVERELQQ